MTKITLVSLSLALVLYGCSNEQEQTTTKTATAEVTQSQSEQTMTTEEASKALNQIFEQQFQASLALNPIQATAIGVHGYNDKLPNFLSPEFRKKSHDFTVEWLDKVRQIDRKLLTGQDRLSYDIYIYNSEHSLNGEQFPGHLIPINQSSNIANFFAQLGSGQSFQPFKTVEDYENWLKRVDGGVAIMEQAITNMNQGIEKKVVQPKALMQKVIPQLAAHVVEDPTQSIFYTPITNMPEDFSDEDKKRLEAAYKQAIVEKLVPAYKNLHDYIKDDYMQHARDSFGLSEQPNGEAWYNYQLKTYTTTDLTAEEIHQFGLDEVARIRAEMEQVMAQVGFEGTLEDWFKYVQANPEFYYDNEEDLLQGYRDLQAKVNKLLPSMFDIAPKTDYEVRAVEAFRAESAAGASYMAGSPDGSRPGIFYVNTFNLKGQPKFGMETLSIHEAAPGHHFQISLQQEIEGLPMFRRFGGLSVFSEGWALYAESIGKEMGMFTDPMQYYGRLSDEMLRAMRLVVDTGLHAKGWSRQDAIDYMMANSSMADTDVVSEVERYIAWPGQAVSYKVGQRIISNLRAEAERKLGDKFEIKAFHREVLVDGAVPMPVLETKIREWIDSQLNEA
ncbi:DUF885 domain-containing protein [Kangiella profundi]|uniref:DUF885 domain-containing protein n=1 Tax=Kangiella profundi TaxID=1561924 RepID=A0A2K9AWP2_9GAMM|nr:DUF885 domain-containing protein [Kangiella profundi]AUD78329.1 DUF885 domain-containing protein [Kangiella profundi]GGF07113.1 hypothetical protein GCM10011356_20710 [Kangiella profundi]